MTGCSSLANYSCFHSIIRQALCKVLQFLFMFVFIIPMNVYSAGSIVALSEADFFFFFLINKQNILLKTEKVAQEHGVCTMSKS